MKPENRTTFIKPPEKPKKETIKNISLDLNPEDEPLFETKAYDDKKTKQKPKRKTIQPMV